MAWICLIVGLVVGALIVVGYVELLDFLDARYLRRKHAVRVQQRSAEADMRQVVQDTVAQMFDAVRRDRP